MVIDIGEAMLNKIAGTKNARDAVIRIEIKPNSSNGVGVLQINQLIPKSQKELIIKIAGRKKRIFWRGILPPK
jgi:hypothetical protein